MAGQEVLGATGCALGQHGSYSHGFFSGLGEVLGLPAPFPVDTVALVLSKSL